MGRILAGKGGLMPKPKVDQNLCVGCGSCVSVCPEVFELDEEIHKSKVKELESYEQPCIKEAIDSCPVSAISE